MAFLSQSVTRTVRFLAVSDPGQLRLTSAAATALTVLLTIMAAVGFTEVTGSPITVVMLGTIVSMQAAAAVKDRTPSARMITTALMALPAASAVVLAASLSEFGKAADVGFIVVLFAAVWVPAERHSGWSRSSRTSSRSSCTRSWLRSLCCWSRS